MDVTLRRLALEDLDEDFVSWHQNDDGHLNYFTGSRRSFSKDDLVDWISNSEAVNTFFYLILVDGKIPVGTIKIGPIDTINRTSDLVCLIGSRAFAGKGLASRAIALANKIAFEDHDIRRLQGGMFEDNIASIKAYCRAGWVIEGRMKGFYWVDGEPMDRICVACFNPHYFPEETVDGNR